MAAAEAAAARAEAEASRIGRSLPGFKAHFTRAQRRLDASVTNTTVASQRTARLYREILSNIEDLKQKSSNLEAVLDHQREIANWADGDADAEAWEAANTDVTTRYNTSHTAALNALSLFTQAVRNEVEGPPPAQAAAAAANQEHPKVQSNSDLKPPVLTNDAEILFVDAWWAKFDSWYVMSNFRHADVRVQRSFLASVLDSTLLACLDSMTVPDTPVYGSDARPGCIELLRAKFEEEQPIFLCRMKYQDLKQQQYEPLADFINRVVQYGRVARVFEMSTNDHFVQKIISSAKPDVRARLLKLPSPSLENIRTEAAIIRSAEACEAGFAGGAVNVVQEWNIRPKTTKADMRAKGITCYRCADKNHKSDQCDGVGLHCGNCNRDGHITMVCMGRRLQPSTSGQNNRGRQRNQRGQRSRSNSKGRTPQQSRPASRDRGVHAVEDVFHPDNSSVNMITAGKTYAAATAASINAQRDSLQNMKIRISADNSNRFVTTFANPDTGSSVTVIGSALVARINAKLGPPSGIKLTAANKQQLREQGTAVVTVQHCGKPFMLTAIVCPDLDDGIIIGRPDLKVMGIIPETFPLPAKSQHQLAAIATNSPISPQQQESYCSVEFDKTEGLRKAEPDHESAKQTPQMPKEFQEILDSIKSSYADVLSDKLSSTPMAGPQWKFSSMIR